ncbi:MAG: toll/interleukin-1 receptor domain-containing protein [Planctomycetota bacterium]
MREFERDVFLCSASQDKKRVANLRDHLHDHGLSIWDFQNPHGGGIKPSAEIEPELQRRLEGSQHLLVLWTKSAAASPWVEQEIAYFHQHCRADMAPARRIYVLGTGGKLEAELPPELDGRAPAENLHHLTSDILREVLAEREARRKNALAEREATQAEVDRMARAVEEARNYYRHDRFWRDMARSGGDVHIFTCARDLEQNSERTGRGGRTVIDKWDYRAVLDISHFFAQKYPRVGVKIEDPISKLDRGALGNPPLLAFKMSNLRDALADKHCIIVGSPDVSDFAEIVLADIHNITPYDDDARKSSGYVIIKNERPRRAPSIGRAERARARESGRSSGRTARSRTTSTSRPTVSRRARCTGSSFSRTTRSARPASAARS